MFSDTPVQSSIKVWLKRIKHSNSQLTFDNVTVCCSHIVISSMSAFWNKKETATFICATSSKQHQIYMVYKATKQRSVQTKSTSFWGPRFFLKVQHSAVVCQLGRAWEGMALAEHARTCWIPAVQVHGGGGGASTWHQRYPTLPHQRLTKPIHSLTIQVSHWVAKIPDMPFGFETDHWKLAKPWWPKLQILVSCERYSQYQYHTLF